MKAKKHIFFTHSWITQLVIEAYIRKEKVPVEDVLILFAQNFDFYINPDLNDKFIKVKNFGFSTTLSIKALVSCIKAKEKVVKYHKWIDFITEGNKYNLYVPHLHPLKWKVMAAYKNCDNVFLIEEGTVSYIFPEELNIKHNHNRLKRRRLNFFWQKDLRKALNISMIDTKILSGTLQFFQEAFPCSQNKIILRNEIESLVQENIIDYKKYGNVLVLTPYIDVLKMNFEDYFTGLRNALDFIVKETSEDIHYKFHPVDSNIVRDETKRIMKEISNRFKLLDDSISLELLCIKSRPKVFTFLSSVSLYALLLKCELRILGEFIAPVDNKFIKINGIDLEPFLVQNKLTFK